MATNKSNADKQKVIDALNKARGMELQAISQYMVHHYLLDELDYGKLCGYMKLIAIDEMRHCEQFAERIMALGGNPLSEKAGPIIDAHTIKEIYPFDANMEEHTVATYSELAKLCRECGDDASASLFDEIIKEENIHLGYYEETDRHMKELGDVFLAKYAATSKHSGPIKSFVKVMEKDEF